MTCFPLHASRQKYKLLHRMQWHGDGRYTRGHYAFCSKTPIVGLEWPVARELVTAAERGCPATPVRWLDVASQLVPSQESCSSSRDPGAKVVPCLLRLSDVFLLPLKECKIHHSRESFKRLLSLAAQTPYT
jgi:hypothetical protein